MCGISGAFLSDKVTDETYINFLEINKDLNKRGPDSISTILHSGKINLILHFSRLAIMDISPKANQPFKINSENHTIYVLCNGEIYNYRELAIKYNLKLTSNSDCEIIPLLYEKYGMKLMTKILNEFNSEHAFVIVDIDILTEDYKVIISTDRFGIRPIFTVSLNNDLYFSSILSGLPFKDNDNAIFERFKPGHYATIEKINGQLGKLEYHEYSYLYKSLLTEYPEITEEYLKECKNKISETFIEATNIRMNSDRPIGCLLSGGLDSSLVCACMNMYLKNNKKLMTFSIGLPGGTDKLYSKKCSDYIGTNHHHFEVSEEYFLEAIPEVIKVIGSYDITTIRASTGQYLISKYISENFPEIKVLLCGDGSDECCNGYVYNHNSPNPLESHKDSIRLLKNIHYFDGLRPDRCISYFGIECRFPFLDHNFVSTYLNINPILRIPNNFNGKKIEKWLLRESFKDLKILPDDILWRMKEAFSDGVSQKNRSWYQIIEEYVKTKSLSSIDYKYNQPISDESRYYRDLFCSFYGNNESLAKTIPYYWMPKWCGNVNDPSARILNLNEK